MTEALRIYPEIAFDQIILCGSIVRRDYPWSDMVAQGRVRRVLNDFGHQDFWAKVVAWTVEDAGQSGAKGFLDDANGSVVQRAHPEWRHSDYFYVANYKSNWVPFLRGELPTPLVISARRGVNWRFRVFRAALILFLLAMVITVTLRMWPRSPGAHSLTEEEKKIVEYHLGTATWLRENSRPRQALEHMHEAFRINKDPTLQGEIKELQKQLGGNQK